MDLLRQTVSSYYSTKTPKPKPSTNLNQVTTRSITAQRSQNNLVQTWTDKKENWIEVHFQSISNQRIQVHLTIQILITSNRKRFCQPKLRILIIRFITIKTQKLVQTFKDSLTFTRRTNNGYLVFRNTITLLIKWGRIFLLVQHYWNINIESN